METWARELAAQIEYEAAERTLSPHEKIQSSLAHRFPIAPRHNHSSVVVVRYTARFWVRPGGLTKGKWTEVTGVITAIQNDKSGRKIRASLCGSGGALLRARPSSQAFNLQ